MAGSSRSVPARLWRVASTTGFAVAVVFATIVPQGIWSGLVALNLSLSPQIPWSVAAIGVILWAIWQYAGGQWPPASTAAARFQYRRTPRLRAPVLARALVAGFLALASLTAAWFMLPHLVALPVGRLPDYTKYPLVTVVAILSAGAVLGAVTEEMGLRGYLFTRLSRSLWAPVAIAVIALVVSPFHGSTQGFLIPVLGWYFVSDLVFGVLSWLSTSIVPGIFVHAVGLLTFLAFIWPTDRQRQQASLPTLDSGFWLQLGLVAILAILSVVAFYSLAVTTANERRREI